MAFAQLIKNATAFIDIRKQLVTTVPGLLMALAVVVLTATAPSWVARPFTCAAMTPLAREAAEHAETLRAWDTTRSVPNLTNEDLIRLRAEEAAYRRQLQRAAVAAQACDPKTCSQALAELKTAADAVKTFTAQAGNYRPRPAAAPTETDPAAQGDRAQNALFEAHRKLAWLEADPTCSAPPVGWDSIAADVLMFGLIGFLLGLMLDPINKALFLQALPEAAGATGTGMGVRMRKFFAAPFVSRAPAGQQPSPLSEHRVQFYIGRGVITEAEYQALIDKYYRFAELTIGLVLPLLITAVALMRHLWLRGRPVGAVAAGGLILLAIALARLGVRRHKEFRQATDDLIAGRLKKLQDEQKARAKSVSLVALQQLVARAEKSMGRLGT
jgi:hypothetical protein